MACKKITATTEVLARLIQLVSATTQIALKKAGRPKEHDIISCHALGSIAEAFRTATPEQWDALLSLAEEAVEQETRPRH